VTVGGSITTTTTYVAGGLEELVSNGAGSAISKYFTAAAGVPTVERVGTNGPLSYLASDGLGSVSEALDGSGSVTFQQLYTPYGVSRYASGSSPTSHGYTGQQADTTTGWTTTTRPTTTQWAANGGGPAASMKAVVSGAKHWIMQWVWKISTYHAETT
jgi:hypothetical protein